MKPDVVVLWWFHNDVVLTGAARPETQEWELQNLIGIRPRTFGRRMIHAMYTAFPCITALARSVTIGRNQRDESYFQFMPEMNPDGWDANMASLIRIIDDCRQSETPIIIYTFGHYPEIESICLQEAVPYIVSVEHAGREHEDKYAVASTDPHFNRAGNRLVADTIFKALKDLNLLPSAMFNHGNR